MESFYYSSSNGKNLVLLLLGVSLLAAVGTFLNYSRSVFSTNQAVILDASGRVRASFPTSVTARLHPHQQAKITLKTSTSTFNLNDRAPILQAEIVTVVKGSVILQLQEKSTLLTPGEACEVTIDTTLPIDMLPKQPPAYERE